MLIHAHFFRRAILTRKVGQIDLVFGMRSGFISRSVPARLHSLCVQQLRFVPSWLTSRHTHSDNILTRLYEKLSQLS